MSATAAHDELDGLIGRTQRIFDGAWSSIDTNAEPCPDGHPGLIFAFGRIGPGSTTPELGERIPQVLALWKDAGHDASVTHSTQSGVALTEVRFPPGGGYAADGLYLSLVASAKGTTIDAQSRCVPGDPDAYNARHPHRDTTP
ncbi:hypothetical protein GCM10009840_20040 [Pseudolysinimonas kribbensis]|uniref:SnoaL-like domain-containing protein n=1 Tax=Pseudolysinimonas kribbensis TaxID=433641 RepID=A0ABQ6JZA4_9MICO|nr:hypothetical protein [Pseudolysinimonas kribbensis]GMA93578.1 hypothetical protein GCM10025881_04020 [Pseudolysinimonas kribbensis]